MAKNCDIIKKTCPLDIVTHYICHLENVLMYQIEERITNNRVSNILDHIITDIIEIKMTRRRPYEELIFESLQLAALVICA